MLSARVIRGLLAIAFTWYAVSIANAEAKHGGPNLATDKRLDAVASVEVCISAHVPLKTLIGSKLATAAGRICVELPLEIRVKDRPLRQVLTALADLVPGEWREAPLPGYHGPVPRLALYRNIRDGTFTDVTEARGLGDVRAYGFGLAAGDINNDGRPDLLTFEDGGPVRPWRNDTKTNGARLGVELEGVNSPRDGTGAIVTVAEPGWTQTRLANSARSCLSANDRRVHLGVGDHIVETLTVRWPSGRTWNVNRPPRNRYIEFRENEIG